MQQETTNNCLSCPGTPN
ncbi:unnamed protein product [Staurois parvus]|uniref:Uncharacterized protein n=1 Tax=Staurois parvus TaxID=386267 RepID=A0ABN9G072_9NEOB|nr:unnamed protein product [Staurois parvus]